MRNYMENRKQMPAVVCALALLLTLGTTFAYMTYRQSLCNGLTAGRNTIVVNEDYMPPGEMREGDNIYRKAVQIRNTGTVDCYVRVFVGVSDSEIEARTELSEDGSVYYPFMEYIEHLPGGWEYCPKADDPLLGGYFYYTEAVEPGTATMPLFEMVNTRFEHAEDVKNYEIFIYSESVQVLDREGKGFTGAEPWKQAWTQFLERR